MSAFVVDSVHLDLLVRLAMEGPRDGAARLPGMGRFPLRWWVPAADGSTEPSPEDRAIEILTGQRAESPRMVLAGAECRLVACDAGPNQMDPSQLGDVLRIENVRSVMHVYPDTIESGSLPGTGEQWREVYRWTDPEYTPTCAEAAALIRSYSYQACEHPEWGDSLAFCIVQHLSDAVLASLPGMDEAPRSWSADTLDELRTGSRP